MNLQNYHQKTQLRRRITAPEATGGAGRTIRSSVCSSPLRSRAPPPCPTSQSKRTTTSSRHTSTQETTQSAFFYTAKRGGGVRAFAIKKDEAMYYVLRERVFELHEAIKTGEIPQKEAAKNRDFRECELCPYLERCNPFLIESIPQGSKIAVFDLDTTLLDPLPRRRAILQELGLPSTIRPSDIHEDELREKFWEMYENPKYVSFDSLIDQGKENVYSHLQRGHAVVGISSSRRYRAMDATLARLANLGVPLNHLILKEEGNYDGDTRFKAKWASRLATNYEIVEYFDRDAAAYSLVARTIEQAKQRRGRADKKLESN